MIHNLQSTIQRLVDGNFSDIDLEKIAAAIQTGQLILTSGGDLAEVSSIASSQIVMGNDNIVGDNNIIITGADAKTIQTLLRQHSSVSFDVITEQVRKRASEKVIDLFERIQLLNKRQTHIGSLYIDVHVLEVKNHRLNILELLKRKDIRGQFDRLGLGKRGERLRGSEVVESKDYPRLMLLGKPGSGKSTFLRHLAVGCAKGTFLNGFIPYLLELRDVDEVNFNLFQHIHENFELKTEEYTEQLLKQGKILILLDGLDEVPRSLQKTVQNKLRKFVKRYDKNRFVMTCRTQTTEYIPEQFSPIEIADFTSEQIEDFSLKWFTALSETPERGRELKEHFIEKLREYPQTVELAVTPVLLSLTCWIFQDSECLPENRSDLYREGLDLLLCQWDEQRGISRDAKSIIYHQLTLEERKRLLSFLAFKKFEDADNFVLFEEIEVCSYISEYLDISFEESKAVLQAISQQHGLLIKRAHEIWSFSHLTFQEYLVSERYRCEEHWDNLMKRITVLHWREVFLILAESLESKNLILKMENELRRNISCSARLKKLIGWIESATNQFQENHTFPGKRAAAMYFILDLITILYQDETFAVKDFDTPINLASTLSRRLENNFYQDDMWVVAVTLANWIDPPQVRSRFYEYRGTINIKHLVEESIERSNSLTSGSWILNPPFVQVLNRNLFKLEAMLPSSEPTVEDCLSSAECCRQVLIDTFQIDQKCITNLSDIENQSLTNYLSGNILLADVLSVSKRQFPSMSQKVKDKMLTVAQTNAEL